MRSWPVADPLLKVLAGALRLWIRSQCDSLGSLELELIGSSWSLLRGRLDGVSLKARDACFQGRPLQSVNLSSGPIAVDMKLLSPGQMLALQQPFQVAGEVSFNGSQLNSALLSEPWRWLGDWMAEQLMGLSPLGALRIDADLIELQVSVAAHQDPARRRFRLHAEQGTVCFRPEAAEEPRILLPMDPAIRIEQAQLGGGQLGLKGHASVTP